METEASPTQMSKPTEKTETETTTLEELEQPPPEEVLVLHEDRELDTDPLRTCGVTQRQRPFTTGCPSQNRKCTKNCFDTTENRYTFMTRWYQPTRRCAAQ